MKFVLEVVHRFDLSVVPVPSFAAFAIAALKPRLIFLRSFRAANFSRGILAMAVLRPDLNDEERGSCHHGQYYRHGCLHATRTVAVSYSNLCLGSFYDLSSVAVYPTLI
jgi:hypothetical protein